MPRAHRNFATCPVWNPQKPGWSVSPSVWQAVVGEIHFQNWSKELKNFMADKKTDDFLIRDRQVEWDGLCGLWRFFGGIKNARELVITMVSRMRICPFQLCWPWWHTRIGEVVVGHQFCCSLVRGMATTLHGWTLPLNLLLLIFFHWLFYNGRRAVETCAMRSSLLVK